MCKGLADADETPDELVRMARQRNAHGDRVAIDDLITDAGITPSASTAVCL